MELALVIVLMCLLLGGVGGWSLFLAPLYLLTGRVASLRMALLRVRQGKGKLVYVVGAGCLDKLWFVTTNPCSVTALRLNGTLIWSCCPNFDHVKDLAGDNFVELHTRVSVFD
jgi:hypothetical protein